MTRGMVRMASHLLESNIFENLSSWNSEILRKMFELPKFFLITKLSQNKKLSTQTSSNPFLFFSLIADSDTGDAESTVHDILTCGTCQKTFALAEIVKFIQHKVLQCNKENYGQCFTQGKLKQMILSLIEAYNGGTLSGTSGDRDSDDGRPLSLANSRRPSISAPISRKSSLSRVHSPPLASPSSHLLEDGSTSTPKRLSEGWYMLRMLFQTLDWCS